jgi:ribosomal protein S18 acetylase RimI-like enzyme
MGDGISLRECGDVDIREVLALWRESGAVPGSTDTEEALRTRLLRDCELFLLAVADDVIAGSIIGGWDGWRGNIYRLVVRPDFRRRGIGSMLVKEVERRLAAMGARRVYALAVRPDLDPAATAFWERMGYAPNPRVEPWVRSLALKT